MSSESTETNELGSIASLEAQFEVDTKQLKTIEALSVENEKLKNEVAHLKTLLASAAQLVIEPKVERMYASTEQVICEMQIQKLQQAAMDRELTLEETKRLDLLIKNLYLAKEKNVAIAAEFTPITKITEAELVKIASSPDPQPDSD